MHPTTLRRLPQTSATFLRIAVLTLLAVVLTGCATSSTTSESDSPVSPDGPIITAPVSMINGAVPPGKLDPLYDVTTMLDTIDAQGNRLFVSRGTRMPGTRVQFMSMNTGDIRASSPGRSPILSKVMSLQRFLLERATTCPPIPR